MTDKKKAILFFALICLCGSVSATSLTFETMFPACAESNETGVFMDNVRCGAYFLAPNLHIDTLWNLGVNAFVDSLWQISDNIINSTVNVAMFTFKEPEDITAGNFISAVSTAGYIIISSPFQWLYGIFSSIFVYLLLLSFEFIKTYLIIAISWSLWSIVIFQEVRNLESLTNLGFMCMVIAVILIGGSILLFVFDVSVWRVP